MNVNIIHISRNMGAALAHAFTKQIFNQILTCESHRHTWRQRSARAWMEEIKSQPFLSIRTIRRENGCAIENLLAILWVYQHSENELSPPGASYRWCRWGFSPYWKSFMSLDTRPPATAWVRCLFVCLDTRRLVSCFRTYNKVNKLIYCVWFGGYNIVFLSYTTGASRRHFWDGAQVGCLVHWLVKQQQN